MLNFRRFSSFIGAGLSAMLATSAALAQVVDVKKIDKLKVAYSASAPNLQDIQLFAARDAGIFTTKYGLDVDLISINGSTPTFQSLISGDVDVAFLDSTHLLLGWEKGQRLKGVANTSPTQPYLLLSQPGIKSLKELAGKRIGISAPGNLSQTIVQITLDRHGVDKKNVQWLTVGGSGSRYQALVSKRIDAGIGQVSHGIRAESDGLSVLANLGDELPDLMGYLFVAKEATIGSKRAAVVKFVAAMLETTRRAEADPAFAAEYYMKYQKQVTRSDALKEHQILKRSKAWGTSGNLRQQAVDFTAKMMQSEGQLKGSPRVDDIFDPKVLDEGARLAAGMK